MVLEKVEGSDLNEDQKEALLNLVGLYQDIFTKGIEGLPQTPLLEFRVELNDYSPLIQKPYVVGPVLEEIMKRLIQQYVDAGFYIRGTSQYVSPAFVVEKSKKSDDTKLEKVKEYFTRNSIQSKERSMDDVIQEVEDHFTFRLVVDFRKLNKRVIPDPYPIPRAKELNRIAKKKVHKTSLDLKYGFSCYGILSRSFKVYGCYNSFWDLRSYKIGCGSKGPAYMQKFVRLCLWGSRGCLCLHR